ncbi:MAG: hypothetical protein KIT09_21285 [Bryobacteraceae bacterium]|nr:hypothetical protein [Bryobacteraceae bacterium]
MLLSVYIAVHFGVAHADILIDAPPPQMDVTPDPSLETAITAPGLSLGGRHTWKYTYRFGGLWIP